MVLYLISIIIIISRIMTEIVTKKRIPCIVDGDEEAPPLIRQYRRLSIRVFRKPTQCGKFWNRDREKACMIQRR